MSRVVWDSYLDNKYYITIEDLSKDSDDGLLKIYTAHNKVLLYSEFIDVDPTFMGRWNDVGDIKYWQDRILDIIESW